VANEYKRENNKQNITRAKKTKKLKAKTTADDGIGAQSSVRL